MGCPQNCSFCNQKAITGQQYLPNENDLEKAVHTAFINNHNLSNTELAFFGGSFTAIEKSYMNRLLVSGSNLVREYGLKGIRISTRPDFISEEILATLKTHNVTAIELGAQSMDDNVLKSNERGHCSDDVVSSSKLIKKNGFELGLQMMTGLFRSSYELDLITAEKLVELKPDTLRVYPTIIFSGTRLEELFVSNEYKPQTIDEAIKVCCKIIELCENNDVNLIRLGLHSSEQLAKAVAGPNHPAFKELCLSNIFLKRLLNSLNTKGNYTVYVREKDLSIATGQKKDNINKLKNLGFEVKFKINNTLKEREFIIEVIN